MLKQKAPNTTSGASGGAVTPGLPPVSGTQTPGGGNGNNAAGTTASAAPAGPTGSMSMGAAVDPSTRT